MEVMKLPAQKYANSVIYRRHSVRNYTDDPLDADQIEHILHAGMAGPSANNAQPWSFVIIDDRKLLDAIAKGHPYARMISKAPLAVVPLVKKAVAERDPFYPQDLGAAVENMLLAAAECGVGSVWCGVHPVKEVEKFFIDLLNIPAEFFPFAVIAFGIPASQAEPSDRFEESRIHRNAW
jgi:nitroreductase